MGLRPAATLVAVRVAFWVLAAARARLGARARAGRLIGDAYGAGERLLLPHLLPVGRALVPPDRGARLRGGAAGGGLLPGLSRGRARARVDDRLDARRRRPDLARCRRRSPPGRSRRSRGRCWASAARATQSSTSLSTRSAFVFTALYSDGLFLALAAGAFLAALRGRAVTAGVLGGLATGTRLLGLALLPPLAILLWRGREPARARAARAARAPSRRGRPLRALSRPHARRPVGVHERPGGLGPGRIARSARSRASGTRCRRPAAARATCSTSRLPGRGTSSRSRSGTSPISCSSVRRALADVGRVAPARAGLRRSTRRRRSRSCSRCRRRVSARQPAALPARRLPALPRARGR